MPTDVEAYGKFAEDNANNGILYGTNEIQDYARGINAPGRANPSDYCVNLVNAGYTYTQNNTDERVRYFEVVFNSNGSYSYKCLDITQKGNWSCDIYWKKKGTNVLTQVGTCDKGVEKINLTLFKNQNGNVVSSSSAGRNTMNNVIDIVNKAINDGHKQVILTGAPGTGKTYALREMYIKIANNCNGENEFVQFHPSYDYSDFVEGLRPVVDANGEMVFRKIDGIFKAFCRKVIRLNNTPDPQTNNQGNNSSGAETKEEDEMSETTETQMQQSEPNSIPYYYFIIDEINRADLSKVFGELMFCLEEGYRGNANAIKTQYQQLETYEVNKGIACLMQNDCFTKGFYIPENVIIIGTMNDIDKSVEAFDFALRRRFYWIDVKANDVLEESLKAIVGSVANQGLFDQLIINIKAMNECISADDGGQQFGLSEAYHIGHAYFKDLNPKDFADKKVLGKALDSIWTNRIESLLREYTRGRKQDAVESFIADCKSKLYDTII